MGLFSRKAMAVVVAYRDLTRTADPNGHGYSFTWPFREAPQAGLRVVVPGMEGLSYGVVLRIATAQDTKGVGPLKPVARLVTQDEFDRAYAKQAIDVSTFWQQTRIAAGLDKGRRVETSEDLPAIYPAAGTANAEDADSFGRGWYGIWKRAEQEERALDEQAAYKSIAYRWFAVRDKGGNA